MQWRRNVKKIYGLHDCSRFQLPSEKWFRCASIENKIRNLLGNLSREKYFSYTRIFIAGYPLRMLEIWNKYFKILSIKMDATRVERLAYHFGKVLKCFWRQIFHLQWLQNFHKTYNKPVECEYCLHKFDPKILQLNWISMHSWKYLKVLLHLSLKYECFFNSLALAFKH